MKKTNKGVIREDPGEFLFALLYSFKAERFQMADEKKERPGMSDEEKSGCGCSGCGSGGYRARGCGASRFVIGFLLGILLTLGGFGLISIGRHSRGCCMGHHFGPMMAHPPSAIAP
jgi:hypothetical protein